MSEFRMAKIVNVVNSLSFSFLAFLQHLNSHPPPTPTFKHLELEQSIISYFVFFYFSRLWIASAMQHLKWAKRNSWIVWFAQRMGRLCPPPRCSITIRYIVVWFGTSYTTLCKNVSEIIALVFGEKNNIKM